MNRFYYEFQTISSATVGQCVTADITLFLLCQQNSYIKKFHKFTETHFISLLAESNPPGTWMPVASKLTKESEYQIYK
jgi:hypothetical protein